MFQVVVLVGVNFFPLQCFHEAFTARVQIWASCWQSKRFHTSRLDQFSKGWAELRISVVQQIAAAPQASPLLHSHVSPLLLHPLLIRVRRESCQFHLASLQVDEEQHIVGRQPVPGELFFRPPVTLVENCLMEFLRSTSPLERCVRHLSVESIESDFISYIGYRL